VGICSNTNLTSDNFICVCDCPEMSGQCRFFENKHSRESIFKEFHKTIIDPSLCGSEYPKIAMILWVLNGEIRDKKKKPWFCSMLFNFSHFICQIKKLGTRRL
jgi:hypothetical protein